jgi:hypothetical protein
MGWVTGWVTGWVMGWWMSWVTGWVAGWVMGLEALVQGCSLRRHQVAEVARRRLLGPAAQVT